MAVAGTNFQVSVNGSAIPTKVYADWGLIPAGLGVGDTFRLLFLSSTKRNATSPDIEDYNAFVQNLAAAGHADIREYGVGFRVVGCTRATDARDNTRTIHTASNQGVPIYWLGGNRVADDYGDFYDGDWDEEANDRDESGNNGPDTSQSANYPFTGCRHNGTGNPSGGPLAQRADPRRPAQLDQCRRRPHSRQLHNRCERNPPDVRAFGVLPGVRVDRAGRPPRG